MRTSKQIHHTDSQRGVALLIAIFVLLIIGAVGVALILSSSTETSIAANYRTATQAFYAAKAGVEEGRGRLWAGNPNSIAATVTAAFTTVGPNPPALPVGRVFYITNPAAGETVSPNVTTNAYYDNQYQKEWGVPITSATVTTMASVTAAGLTEPLYKWVRITATTEKSTNHDVNKDGVLDNANPLFYDGTQQFLASQIPPTVSTTPQQVYTVTALAVTPSGSTRMVEYTTSMTTFNLNLPSALTFDGPTPVYNAPSSNPFMMNGNDRSGGVEPPTCTVPVQPAKPAIGDINNADTTTLTNDIPKNRQNHYVGAGATTPSIANVSSVLPSSEQTVSGLQQLVANLTNVANQVVTPTPGSGGSLGTATSLPNMGTAANPTITVVNGNLTLSGNNTGYGILVVTGTYTFSGNSGWNGVVLVIGQGVLNENGGGNNQYDGAVFVAKTTDSSTPPKPLPTLGIPTVNWNGGGGNGVYYDSCWINAATGSLSYNVLSFREVN
jgi:Tfp pilus assembly protein PilX